MTLPRVLVCNAGTLRVFRVADELNRRGLPTRCASSLYFGPRAFFWLPEGLRRRAESAMANRRCDALAGRVRTHPFPELLHLLAARLGVGSASRWITWRNELFGRWAAEHCLDGIDLVWSFDTSSLEVFEEARARGIKCVLDVSIAHPALGNELFRLHAAKHPSYAADLQQTVPARELARRMREMDLADVLVAGSSVVADSLLRQGVDAAKIEINPYGVDLDMFHPSPIEKRTSTDAVFLFVGWFSQRKGIYYLLEAWSKARLWEGGATLRLVGGERSDLPLWRGDLPHGVEVVGKVSHAALPDVFASADVFVFPSILEGFAKVVLEAMAAGLPVITTAEACGEGIVVHRLNGLLTVSGEIPALQEAMRALANDVTLRRELGENSFRIARDYSWAAYGGRCENLCKVLAERSRRDFPRPRVLVNNAGTLHVFKLAEQLQRHGLLHVCTTTLYFGPRAFRFLPALVRVWLDRVTGNRRCHGLSVRMRTHAFPELVHLLAVRTGLGDIGRLIIWRNRVHGRWVGETCLDGVDIAWSFDTSSLELFEAARVRGIKCVLEVSIAHPALGNRILEHQARLRSKYSGDLAGRVSEADLVRRRREIELADIVVAGSSFVADSLLSEGVPASKVRINPYGVDLGMFNPRLTPKADSDPVVFLFVSWFSQRKGIYDLLEAWLAARLWERGAVLQLVGGTREELRHWSGSLPEGVEILGRLAHRALPDVFRAADVFVFPSLFEGFAKVILEALASGLPIITTPAACDSSAVIHERNGLLLDAGEITPIAQAMERLHSHPDERRSMGTESAKLARSFSWNAYGQRCLDICRDIVRNNSA